MLQGVGIEYRPGGQSGKLYRPGTGDDYFVLTDEKKNKIREVLREGFRDELSKGENFTIVDEPGPDVLLIRGGLLDVVSFVPPEPIGRTEYILSSVGEATLVLEIRDSISGAIIARSVDRRAAESAGRSFTRSNPVMNKAEVRRLARYWGRLLRDQLDNYLAQAE